MRRSIKATGLTGSTRANLRSARWRLLAGDRLHHPRAFMTTFLRVSEHRPSFVQVRNRVLTKSQSEREAEGSGEGVCCRGHRVFAGAGYRSAERLDKEEWLGLRCRNPARA